MKINVGGIDRAIRIVAGLPLSGAIGVWGWIGIVPIATGLFSFCPLYNCPMDANKA